jgi:putative nucleotidyltransferase-like protein
MRLLQAAAQGQDDLSPCTMQADQVRWVIDSGFGPLLWYTTRAADGATAWPFWPLVRGTDLAARLLTIEQYKAMGEVLEACRGRMPPVTLLKGISIAAQYYPAPHLRLMRDIDVLVDENALPALESVLFSSGYQQQSRLPSTFYATHHHSRPFVHPVRGLWIEIHRGLFPPSSALGMDRLFRRETLEQQRQLAVFQGHEVFRLSPEWQLAYIAAHWASEFPHIGVVALLDVIYLLRQTAGTLNWAHLLDWLEGSAAAAPLYLLLSYLDANQVVDLPPEVLRNLGLRQSALGPLALTLMQRLLDRYLMAGPPAGRVFSAYRLEILWKTLLGPGSPRGNLLRVPWHWLVASRLGTGGARRR